MLIQGGHGLSGKKVATQSKFSKPCWGHFFLLAADEEADVVKLSFQCLASTEPANAETVHNERLWFVSADDDPKKIAATYEKALFYALSFGLVTQEQIDSGKPLDIKWQPAIGKQCILHLEQDKKDTQYTRIAYKGIYGFNSEEAIANNVPLDMELIKSAGIQLQPRKGQGPTASGGPANAAGPTTAKSNGKAATTIKHPLQPTTQAGPTAAAPVDLGEL